MFKSFLFFVLSVTTNSTDDSSNFFKYSVDSGAITSIEEMFSLLIEEEHPQKDEHNKIEDINNNDLFNFFINTSPLITKRFYFLCILVHII